MYIPPHNLHYIQFEKFVKCTAMNKAKLYLLERKHFSVLTSAANWKRVFIEKKKEATKNSPYMNAIVRRSDVAIATATATAVVMGCFKLICRSLCVNRLYIRCVGVWLRYICQLTLVDAICFSCDLFACDLATYYFCFVCLFCSGLCQSMPIIFSFVFLIEEG